MKILKLSLLAGISLAAMCEPAMAQETASANDASASDADAPAQEITVVPRQHEWHRFEVVN